MTLTIDTLEKLKSLQSPWNGNGMAKIESPANGMPITGKQLLDQVREHTAHALELAKNQYITLVVEPDIDNVEDHQRKLPTERYLVLEYIAELKQTIAHNKMQMDELTYHYTKETYKKGSVSHDMVKLMFKADGRYKELKLEQHRLEKEQHTAEALDKALSTKKDMIPGIQGKLNAMLKSRC
jgi:intein-encoded DNA endonuclease-like protein